MWACTSRLDICPSNRTFYDYLTGRELLDYFARFFGYTPTERRERVERFLDRVGLTEAGNVQLRKYSKGMLQRVGIAQAILHDPQVVFLDEPMSGLDPVGRREVRDIILDLRKHGRTVLFSRRTFFPTRKCCAIEWVCCWEESCREWDRPAKSWTCGVQGMEILFELPAGRALPPDLADHTTQTGSRLRVEVPEEELYAALERLHLRQARILSVTPIKPTLEDYFFRLVGQEKAEHHAVEVYEGIAMHTWASPLIRFAKRCAIAFCTT